MSKIALLFAGQGSQYINMGLDFIENNTSLEYYLEQANKILGYDVKEVLNTEKIHDTLYTQPLMFIASVIMLESFKTLNIDYEALLGFSLGEYTAYYASGMLTFEECLKLISNRSLWMKEASDKYLGSMRAVLGLNSKKVSDICQSISNENEFVSVANYNEPNQTVITGSINKLNEVQPLLLEAGARRVLPLKVSGPFHSYYMKEVGQKLNAYIKSINVKNPEYPIYLNTTAKQTLSFDLASVCEEQVQSSVRFYQSILQMKEDGFDTVIEIGPGNVLSNLVRKIDDQIIVKNIGSYEDYLKLKEAL